MEIIELYNPPEEILDYKNMTREEMTEEERKHLVSEKIAIQNTIASPNKAISSLKDDTYLLRLQNKLEIERLRLTARLEQINSDLRIYEGKPDLTDEEIDIYLIENEQQMFFKGQIFLHNTPVMISNIEYRGPDNGPWLGDIGYRIEHNHYN